MFSIGQRRLVANSISDASSGGSARRWQVVCRSSHNVAHTSYPRGPRRAIPTTMPLMESGVSPSVPHSRGALAVAHAVVDSHIRGQAVPLGSNSASLGEVQDHIQELVQRSQDAWGLFVNHPFPREMANGHASLNGFRHYMIQDAAYLDCFIRVKMESIGNLESKASFQDLEDFAAKLSHSLQYSTDARGVCERQLGVPKDAIANEPMSDQLKHSAKLYSDVARDGDWLAMHIVLLPCIMGYYNIASKLLNDPATVRNTPFYPLWIQENASGGSFERYKQFINQNIERMPEGERRWDYWAKIFSSACGTEKAFLDLAHGRPKYDIIKEGKYKIRSYGQGGAYLVLGEGGRVVVQRDDPGSKGTWELTNSSEGYSIKMGTLATLGAFVKDDSQFPPYYVVNSKGEGYDSWSILPIGGQNLYQLLVPKLRFTLDIITSGNHSNVFVANNYQGPSQLWMLEPVA